MKLFKTVNRNVIQYCCNFLKFSLPSDLLLLDMPRSLIAIDCTKIYIGILDLNKLALLCCSL